MLEEDIEQMLAGYAARIEGHDDVKLAGAERTATFYKDGAVLWRAYAEPLGRFNPAFGVFRWWWHGRAARTPSRLDVIVADGARFHVPELTTEQVSVARGDDAHMLCAVAAHLAGAKGLVSVEDAHGALFVALFDSPGTGGSMSLFPPPSVVPAAPRVPDFEAPPPSDGSRRYSISAPLILATSPIRVPSFPIRSAAPSPNAPVTEPTRDVLAPLLQTAFAIASGAMPDGVVEVMLIIIVDVMRDEARYIVQLVALTPTMQLVSLDSSMELAEATERMLEADGASGNGRWSKLAVRMRRTERGAQVEVDVKA
jgi:hypothetical protein